MKPGEPFNPFKMFTGIFVPEAIVRCRELLPGAKLCYGRLVRYAGEDGRCDPSLATLGRELGVSRDQAKRYMRELAAKSLIRVKRRKAKAGDNDTSTVVFLWHTMFEAEGVGASMHLPGRGTDAPPVGASMHRGVGACMHPKESQAKRVIEERRAHGANFPKTANALLGFYPHTRKPLDFVADLVEACHAVEPDATDERIAEGVRASYRQTQRGPGLFKSTVPEWLKDGGATAGDPIAAKFGWTA